MAGWMNAEVRREARRGGEGRLIEVWEEVKMRWMKEWMDG